MSRDSAGGLAAVACIVLSFAAMAEIPLAERRSGYEFMGRETRAMQDDDVANPGMLWVLDGEALWNRKAGAAGRACADCHGDAGASMKGVAARYPGVRRGARAAGQPRAAHQRLPDRAAAGGAARLREQGICSRSPPTSRGSRAGCRSRSQSTSGRSRFSTPAATRSSAGRGSSISPAPSATTSTGARRLAGNPIPQAHPTGYPLYRLEWQGLGSLQRRLRNCFIGMRAEPYEYGAPEFVDLELYLMWRARGMKMESPAVRP